MFVTLLPVMTITTHAAVGAFLGRLTGNPLLAFLLGFISHFLIDMIPHGDSTISDNYRIHKKHRKKALAYVALDASIALFFVLWFVNTQPTGLHAYTWGIIGSILPDFLIGLYELTRSRLLVWFHHLHFFFHDLFIKKNGDVPLVYALLGQAIFIVLLQTQLAS